MTTLSLPYFRGFRPYISGSFGYGMGAAFSEKISIDTYYNVPNFLLHLELTIVRVIQA